MRPMLAALALALGLALAPPPALAEDVNRPLRAELAAEDRALNLTYRQLTARLTPPARQRLVGAQLAWIRFRDAAKRAEADRFRGGTMAATAALASDTHQTRLRTRDLKAWLKDLAKPPFAGLDAATRARVMSQQTGAHAQAAHLLSQAVEGYAAPLDPTGRALAAQAQAAWVAFRDRETAFAEAVAGPRGDAALARQMTLTWLTGSRAQDLQASIDERQ